MQSRECVPIVSGNTKYLGLSIPEWTINLLIHSGYVIFLGYKHGWPLMIIQVVCNIFYVNIISKIEENIGGVLMTWRKIPDVIWGYFNSLPIRAFRHDNRSSAPSIRD